MAKPWHHLSNNRFAVFRYLNASAPFSMQCGNSIQFPQGVLKTATLAELKNYQAWKRALHNKCKDHRYYEIVEETLQDRFEYHHLLLEDDSGKVRAIQPVFFVRQNLIEGVPGKISAIVDRFRKIFPRF